RSTAVLEALLPLVERGSERSDALFALARAGPADLRRVTALCEDALAEAGDDHARAASVLTYLSWVRMLQADIRAALHDAREGLRRAELAGDPALVARAIARVAMSETWTLEITPGLLERGVKIENGLDRWLELHASPRWTLARRLKLADEFDAARELTETAEADAAARGDEVTHTLVQYFRVGLETAAGRWNEAMRRANEGAELAEQLQDEQLRGMMADARAAVLVLLGREAEARAALRDALAVSDAASDELLRIGKLDALGLLELSLGNMRTAADLLRPLPGRLLGLGWNHPMVIQGPNAIEALAGVGELDLAERHLAAYEARARRAGLPTALATAARCRGLLAAARSDLVFAVEALESALVLHDAGAQPFERARTLLALGGVRRRAKQKRQAREALSDALDAFESLGARLWAEKARHELDQIGGRRSEGAALTATEQQLAGLVARGLSNREVAASLYVTVHTVEGHLTTIYRKLGIRSRTQLAILMRDPP
ncbi:MAG: LuxR C-terminal-related transcriptional regulator, partial [Candidatus Limnocylindria bacterium]